jgi:transcriptional regulator of acetoin/glycerol metabolism
VRELRNLIEYAVNFCEGKVIRTRHLPGYLLHPVEPPPTDAPASAHMAAPAPLPPAETRPGPAPGDTQPANWADMERAMILDALRRAGGKRQQAADSLGWGRSTLWRKMKRHNIG